MTFWSSRCDPDSDPLLRLVVHVIGFCSDSWMDYTVHEAWNDATNVYLMAGLLSVGLLLYARRNKRQIMRIFTVPPPGNSSPEPNFYDNLQKVRLRQQLDMYSIARKYEQEQGQLDSVQLTME
ncbi:small integral membrane protein 19 [Hypanus sabinus]|uniref:small integral membrane protein 19 n=1 Tax=Hypanus sabinus TaxID=79690 RepID=UPI0028C4E0E6|nr:small integral membrane protein 19 [Hypanus sabinus]